MLEKEKVRKCNLNKGKINQEKKMRHLRLEVISGIEGLIGVASRRQGLAIVRTVSSVRTQRAFAFTFTFAFAFHYSMVVS